jgi:CdiI N-terminal domain
VFNIELLGRPEGEGDGLFNWGRLTLGRFQEEFQAPLYEWAPGDYAAHWLESAQRLLRGSPVAVFLTHMARPDAAYHVGWPAWREGDRVYVQERLFLREQLAGSFDPEFPEVHVGPRQELSKEGMRICQWEVAVRHVAAFVERRAPGQSALPTPQPPSSGSS